MNQDDLDNAIEESAVDAFPLRLHILCARSNRRDEYLLERKYAQAFAASRNIRLNFDALLEKIRTWCAREGIDHPGRSVSFTGESAGRQYSGTATRFHDELSVLLHVEGEGKTRYRVLGVWDDHSWLVLYQEPFLGVWRSWPAAARDFEGIERDRSDERSAREGFEWVCTRNVISRARLYRGETLVAEFFASSIQKR